MNRLATIRMGCFTVALVGCLGTTLRAQPPQCDPSKVVTADQCAKCHQGEVNVWRSTPHFRTFEQLHRDPRAKEIAEKMNQRSIKRGDLCINCHYTLQSNGDRNKVVSGISCESCHGAARDWLVLHNDYGGPTVTRSEEDPAHAEQRIAKSIAAGMRNPRNLYLVAQSCLHCHTVPHESLVNEGSHKAGSEQFELVAWSQGSLRHNFLRTNGESNERNPPERLRVMYVVGQIADLEFSTRATAMATQRATFGITAANRAATKALRLYELQQKIQDPLIEEILKVFSKTVLKTNNPQQLTEIADRINELGTEFAEAADGKNWPELDAFLPGIDQYR